MQGSCLFLFSLFYFFVVVSSSSPRNNKPPSNDYFKLASKEQIRRDAGGEKFSEVCFIPEGRSSCAPQFIIAGSMKSGTTSMQKYLLNHPQMLPLRDGAKIGGRPVIANKEIRFFNNERLFNGAKTPNDIRMLMHQYYNVFKLMPPSEKTAEQLFSGDITPMYICKNFVAKRAYFGLPEAKVIVMLRDPIERAYSEFWFRKSISFNDNPKEEDIEVFMEAARSEIGEIEKCGLDFTQNFSLEKAVENNECTAGLGKIKNSVYISQIIEWQEMYQDQLLIINSNDFYNNTAAVMNEICNFLGLQAFDWEPITTKAYNIFNERPNGVVFAQGQDLDELESRYPPLPNHYQLELQEFFDPFNKALGRYLSQPNFWPYK